MTGQHGLKGIIFGFLGFKFLPWLLPYSMILFGFLPFAAASPQSPAGEVVQAIFA